MKFIKRYCLTAMLAVAALLAFTPPATAQVSDRYTNAPWYVLTNVYITNFLGSNATTTGQFLGGIVDMGKYRECALQLTGTGQSAPEGTNLLTLNIVRSYDGTNFESVLTWGSRNLKFQTQLQGTTNLSVVSNLYFGDVRYWRFSNAVNADATNCFTNSLVNATNAVRVWVKGPPNPNL